MFSKKDWLAALAVSIFLALVFVGTSLAPAVLLPKSALSADAHALMPDFDEMAVFSAQQSAVEEAAPDELFIGRAPSRSISASRKLCWLPRKRAPTAGIASTIPARRSFHATRAISG